MRHRRPQTEQGGAAARAAALRDAFRSAGGAGAIDYLHQQLTVEEAAVFLGTTTGQLYNLINRREIPYVRWGKRGKRFRRIDLIAWQEDRRRPALE
jgi:excisionase family DNA binding protein